MKLDKIAEKSQKSLKPLVLCLVLIASLAWTETSPRNGDTNQAAQPNNRQLDIASGDFQGNYYQLASQLVAVLTSTALSQPCRKGGSCGIPNTKVSNISSQGSVDNIDKLLAGQVDVAIVQADTAYRAYHRLGGFAKQKQANQLRAIASLYPEYLYILVRRSAKINHINELRGKRVALGGKGSGTYVNAKLILDAYQIKEHEMDVTDIGISEALKKLENKSLDALFYMVGKPSALAPFLENSRDYQLLSIDTNNQAILLKQHKYLVAATLEQASPDSRADGNDVTPITSIATHAILLTTATRDKKWIYQLTRALWDPSSLDYIRRNSHYALQWEQSLAGIAIPLHAGAKQFYDQQGKRF